VFRQVRHQLDDHVATGTVNQLPALAAAIEQASLLQGFQVKRQRRQRQAEAFAHLAGGFRPPGRRVAVRPGPDGGKFVGEFPARARRARR